MDETLEEGNELAHPFRGRLFDTLSGLKRPVATDELAKLLDRHPNGIRQHLEVLSDAGYLVRNKERRGRGRPRDLWSIDPDAMPGGARPTAYVELSRWLGRVLDEGTKEPGEVEARSRQIGRELASGGGNDLDPERHFHDTLAAMGFQPSRKRLTSKGVTYCLNNCPYRDVVRERQELICSLHRGITGGLLEKIDPSSSLSAFTPKDPDKAGCTIKIDGPLAA
ncbi:MAG: helix-turn-helix domain-containing protein [Solirubrobacterales bacterium]|nr:helix-turn-helix domain-containing protein [Solirubrobacterales bacterium]